MTLNGGVLFARLRVPGLQVHVQQERHAGAFSALYIVRLVRAGRTPSLRGWSNYEVR
jgi:hypothetical protein